MQPAAFAPLHVADHLQLPIAGRDLHADPAFADVEFRAGVMAIDDAVAVGDVDMPYFAMSCAASSRIASADTQRTAHLYTSNHLCESQITACVAAKSSPARPCDTRCDEWTNRLAKRRSWYCIMIVDSQREIVFRFFRQVAHLLHRALHDFSNRSAASLPNNFVLRRIRVLFVTS